MCFIVSIVCLALSYNFFLADNLLAALGSLVVAILFIYFMIKNILFVRNLKKKN
jgi:hypothetical protein